MWHMQAAGTWCYCCQPVPWWPACVTDTMCLPCLPGRRGKGGRGRGRGRGKGAPKAAEWDYYPQASQQSKKQQQRVVSYKEDSDLSLSDDAGGRVVGCGRHLRGMLAFLHVHAGAFTLRTLAGGVDQGLRRW